MITDKWVYPLLARYSGTLKVSKMLNVVKWMNNSMLNNQLLIYWMIISRNNTIGWSIKIDNQYVQPWGKKLVWDTNNFYRAVIYDLNYLKRYHKVFNPWKSFCSIKASNYSSSCTKLDSQKYRTFSVVIMYDPSIKVNRIL
jgi:hypothetical protein